MAAIGVYSNFRLMTTIFFQVVKAVVNINGQTSKSFNIRRGVRQGCPLDPYLLLIVGEVINHMVNKAMATRELEGIISQGNHHNQRIAHYADDTSFTMEGRAEVVRNLVNLLKPFSLALGSDINCSKSTTYWHNPATNKPRLLDIFHWKWVQGEISKLLGTTFGLSLDVHDVIEVLIDKTKKKITYWRT